MGNGSEMETLASHFPLHSRALDFPMITFVLTYSPKRRLRVIIHSAGRGERAESIAAAQAQHSKPTPQLPSFEGSGELLHPRGGSLFFSMPTGSACAGKAEECMAEAATVLPLPPLVMGIRTTLPGTAPYLQGFLSAQTLSRPHPPAPPFLQDLGWEGLVAPRPPCLAVWVQLEAGRAGSAMAQHSLFLSNPFYC